MVYNHNITTKLFELAKEVLPVNNARLVAAVVYRNRIVSIGVNSYKTHPKAKKLQNNENKPHIHAEMSAIFQAKSTFNDDLSDCDLYVVRAKKSAPHNNIWVYGISKPCKGCQNLLQKENIKNVFCVTTEHSSIKLVSNL